MSRCFPFPPHGYTRNGATGNALIESIKFQSVGEKAHAERKKEKKERRKERRHQKKEQKRSHIDGDRVKERNVEFQNDRGKKIGAESIDGYLEKVKDDTEQLERSGITEEHEHPVSSQGLGYLSDSSQHSKKRKREYPLSIEKGSENGGTVFRIRLRKHEESEGNCNKQIDRTIGEAPPVSRNENQIVESAHYSQSGNAQSFNLELARKEISSSRLPFHVGSSESKRKKRKVLESTYESLFENWVPLAQEFDADELGDNDWLFCSKRQNRGHGAEPSSCRNGSDMLGCRDSSFFPRAQFLPEAGVYALPYTLPY